MLTLAHHAMLQSVGSILAEVTDTYQPKMTQEAGAILIHQAHSTLYHEGAWGLGYRPPKGRNTGHAVFAQPIVAHVVGSPLDGLAYDGLQTRHLGLVEHALKHRVLHTHTKPLEIAMQSCPATVIGDVT